MKSFSLFSIYLSRLFLLAFAGFSIFHNWKSLNLSIFIMAAFVAALIFFRVKRNIFSIMPDYILFSLPYFILISTFDSARDWFLQWQIPFLLVSIIATIFCFFEIKQSLKGSKNLLAVWCTIIFIIIFSTLLYTFFPSFNLDLYRLTLLNLIVFLAGVPVSFAAINNFDKL
jgi:hypothetical protein